jgi:hypothetical protein
MIFFKHRLFTSVLALTSLIVFLAGCASTPMENGKTVKKQDTSLEASLQQKGDSALTGEVTLAHSGDHWLISVNVSNGVPGTTYRVAFYSHGNCTSPNAFSAGKLWAPEKAPKDVDPATWIPAITADFNGNIVLVSKRLPNPASEPLSVFRDRAVLIFQGRKVEALQPDVPNDVVSCGVFGTPQSLLDNLLK